MNQDHHAGRTKLLDRLRQQIGDQRVLRAMERVPRESFVPEVSRHLAYEDVPLPIDCGQTISQPFIVALMTEALQVRPADRVLEVGTGSGYQAAVLAELAGRVVTVERYPPLLEQARRSITALGYRNVEVRQAEQTLGWKEGAPYDGIIVTAGAPAVPPGLIDQLAEGGRMVIPVGTRSEQQLVQVIKRGANLATRYLGACRFVPLIAAEAWEED